MREGKPQYTLVDEIGGGRVKRQTAGFLFLCVCVALAVLLLTDAITPLVSGEIFAVALVLLGVLSRGFRG